MNINKEQCQDVSGIHQDVTRVNTTVENSQEAHKFQDEGSGRISDSLSQTEPKRLVTNFGQVLLQVDSSTVNSDYHDCHDQQEDNLGNRSDSSSQTDPKSLLGLPIHCPGKGSYEAVLPDSRTWNPEQDVSSGTACVVKGKTMKPCPVCQKLYVGDQGVRVHIARSHQEISRDMITEKYKRNSIQSVAQTAHVSQLSVTSVEVTSSNSRTITSNNHSAGIRSDHIPDSSTHQLRTPDPTMQTFADELTRLLEGERDPQSFDSVCARIQDYMAKAINKLPGPKHPASKFYAARKKKKEECLKGKGYKNSSNPQRDRKKRSGKSKEQYMYEKVQFEYYNRRRKAWRAITGAQTNENCQIPIDKIQEHFEKLLTIENHSCRPIYESPIQETVVDSDFTEEEISMAMKGIAIDTAPGSDRVIMRVIKELSGAKVISLIASIMQKWAYVPSPLKIARAVLIHKGGDSCDLNNWRSIMIFSILRRIIERALDGRIRKQFQPCAAQRGFVSTPGAHINSSLINGVLQAAKKAGRNDPHSTKSNCTVIFLDISKAFDNVSHEHVRKCLESLPFSRSQQELLMLLITDNSVQIEVNRKKTKKISIRRGVPQGAPLSPTLFNIAIDFILKEVTEQSVAKAHGFMLGPDENYLSGLGFADDTAVIGATKESAMFLAQIVIDRLGEIGLEVNCKKSKGIVIENGQLQPQATLKTLNGNTINVLQAHERVKYLGIDFEDEIVLDKAVVMSSINNNLNLLVATPLLKPSQKNNIINQFIWPSVVYPLQSAPLKNLTKEFLKDIDVCIRGAVKQILTIPNDSPDGMIYSQRKLRGLGMICASWEAYLQHYNICCKLDIVDDTILHACRDFSKEKDECLRLLDIEMPEDSLQDHISSRKIRDLLRKRMFDAWRSLPSKGLGVQQFAEYPRANSWMLTGEGLSSSQWTTAVKMNVNCCSTRGTKGRFAGSDSCRYKNCMKKETLCHVLQDCPHGNESVIARHNHVVNIIEKSLKSTGYEVYKEVHCSDASGNKRADLVVLDRQSKTVESQQIESGGIGYILDPTIRFEKNGDQSQEVQTEKAAIYDSTHPYFRSVYPDIKKWETIGLFIGSRGAITRFFVDNLVERFGLPKSLIKDIVLSVISDSVSILNSHIFSNTA